ncbi:peptidoglycan-binding protein [Anabaena sp. FACHB-1237]|uniref:peptidoglycan-binding domain-containing protein n=1 Tax=Anabaena sp. FACHB-1237 TaxID=2692769 RepID=UPI0016804C0E|nr:peptidoglycan-binding domain-containing protein [Anabaena sp. FACHB-1237]MBD2138662.1 peptidoglycan-binding protein [Anabaena sp. FACHB-1237]
MEYMAYSYMYMENEDKTGNIELILPQWEFNLLKFFKSSTWLTMAGITVLLAVINQMQFASAEYVRTNGSCLYVRTEPSIDSSSVACLPNGRYIGETGNVSNGYATISTGRYRGYYVAERWTGNTPGYHSRRYNRRYGAARRVSLGYGARGHRVRKIQRALGIRADGVYGSGTVYAVRNFQRRNGLRVDGVAGPQTRRVLGIDS